MDDVELTEDCEPLIEDSSKASNGSFNNRRIITKKPRRCWGRRGLVVGASVLGLGTLLYLVYYWREMGFIGLYRLPIDDILKKPANIISFNQLMHKNFEFNIRGLDVMVFLHIQKTGGTTFGKHLVQDLDLDRDCECRKNWKKGRRHPKLHCDCFRPGKGSLSWLFSRYSTGWKCGLHPDWTELTGCVDTYLKGEEGGSDPHRYFYFTILREPTARYLSEFRHVQRGATWKTSTNMCGGRVWADIIPRCYKDEDWSDVEIEEFMNCPHNPAANRQTRMLADLELVDCHNKSAMEPGRRNLILLESAKANLEKMAYFALTEQQRLSQYIFQQTFNIQFKTSLEQINATRSSSTQAELDSAVLARIREINSLDVQLYSFAQQLLAKRLNILKEQDESFEENMSKIKDGLDLDDDDDDEEY